MVVDNSELQSAIKRLMRDYSSQIEKFEGLRKEKLNDVKGYDEEIKHNKDMLEKLNKDINKLGGLNEQEED